jgi:hypothetical protein
MYGPFLAIARKKRCSREIFRLDGDASRRRPTLAARAVETAPLAESKDGDDTAPLGARARARRTRTRSPRRERQTARAPRA